MTSLVASTAALTLHIGERCQHGNLDWFPVWSEVPSHQRSYNTHTNARYAVEEGLEADPSYLVARNFDDEPLVLFEGSLFDAGYQHRALTTTVALPSNQWTTIPTVCVERGRWQEEEFYELDAEDTSVAEVINQVAPLRVRSAIRGVNRTSGSVADMFEMDQPQQERVWQEVSRYSEVTQLGVATESLVSLEARYRASFDASSVSPLPGQTGVIVAQGGYPVALEVFDHPDTLRERFGMILEAYRLDSHGLGYQETPSRRARRFVHIVNQVALTAHDELGLSSRQRSMANPYVATDATVLGDTTIHMTSLNVQHALLSS